MQLTVSEGVTKPKMPPPRVSSQRDNSSVTGWRQELDDFYSIMAEFSGYEVDEILAHLSSFSARMSAIRTQIVRSESRSLNSFRTKEIDPFLEECDRQYKIWSRQQAVRQFDWEVTRGL